jgi:hypothetical protein
VTGRSRGITGTPSRRQVGTIAAAIEQDVDLAGEPPATGPIFVARGGDEARDLGGPEQRRFAVEGVRLGRELAGPDLGLELRHGGRDVAAELGVALHELGLEVGVHAEEVVDDQHLAVALHARADADGGDGQLRGDDARQLHRHALQHDGVGAGLLDGLGVAQDGPRALRVLALDLEAAHGVHRLGREADVAHHRDAGAHHLLDGLADLLAALELHALGAALLEEAAGVEQRLVHAALVGHERHVGHHVGAADASADGARVVDDVFERDRQRGGLALDDHASMTSSTRRPRELGWGALSRVGSRCYPYGRMLGQRRGRGRGRGAGRSADDGAIAELITEDLLSASAAACATARP